METTNTVDIIAAILNLKPQWEDVFYVKTGEEITVNLTNEEGVHGIFIEGTNVNLTDQGATKVTFDKPGEYPIRCSVYCGVTPI